MTARLPRVELTRGRERALLGGHPWVMSGSIAKLDGSPEPGELVEVAAADGRMLGVGDYDPSAQIRVRLLDPDPKALEDPQAWLTERLRIAVGSRRANPLLAGTNAVRLVHAEADRLPGLTIDRYDRWIVLKPSTPGMLERARDAATWLVSELELHGAWIRGEVTGGMRIKPEPLIGEIPEEPIAIHETPPSAARREYWLDLRQGQKTGFYLDQRDARDLFQTLAHGRGALDLYAYTGGFSVAAERGGARAITAVESSTAACALLRRNSSAAHIENGDVQRFLEGSREYFDLIAVDPPPFAKHKRDVEAACRAYRELHTRVFARAACGADVLTFTCSHHVQPEIFRRTVAIAARQARREVQLLRSLGSPPDHPVSLHHPEGAYLSGLWLRVLDEPKAG